MPPMVATERRIVAADGGSLEVLISGVDGPILCEAPHPVVPGVSAPCEPLTGLGRIVRVSPRGVGASSPWRGPRDATIEQLVDDLEGVRLDLNLGPWIVVGHSAGGLVALKYARRYPTAAAALILVATPPSLRRLYADPRSRNSALHSQWRAELTAHPPSSAPTGAGVFRVVQLRRGLWMAFEGDRPLTPLLVPEVLPDLAVRLKQTVAFDPQPWLDEVHTPTLVLCGAADDVVPLEHCQALCAALPNADLVILERSGHAPMATEPAAYRAAVEHFLARPRPPHRS